jgi:hypothetical protein
MASQNLSNAEGATGLSTQSSVIRQRVRDICTTELSRLIPQPDSTARGFWNDASIRKLTAVFEIQRIDLLSDCPRRLVDINLIAKVIELLAGRKYFPDLRSWNLLLQMEPHLRLLAAALRLYKYHAFSLEESLHKDVYEGITNLWTEFKNHQGRRGENFRVEEWNVLFLVKHCQYLLLSIDSTESLPRKIAKRATIGVDAAIAGISHSFQNIRPAVVDLIKRQRSRPKWHDEFIQLEDACWTVFASDIQVERLEDRDVIVLIEEAKLTIHILRASLDDLQQRRQPSRVKNFVRNTVGRVTHELQDSGPYEEHGEYLGYGILDLLYQLSFRIRKRARRKCFDEFVQIIRGLLEQAPSSAKLLQIKATDLWNRISELAESDQILYGETEDRQTIASWIRNRANHSESAEYSTAFVLNLNPY